MHFPELPFHISFILIHISLRRKIISLHKNMIIIVYGCSPVDTLLRQNNRMARTCCRIRLVQLYRNICVHFHKPIHNHTHTQTQHINVPYFMIALRHTHGQTQIGCLWGANTHFSLSLYIVNDCECGNIGVRSVRESQWGTHLPRFLWTYIIHPSSKVNVQDARW